MINFLKGALVEGRGKAIPVKVRFIGADRFTDGLLSGADEIGIALASANAADSHIAYPWGSIYAIMPVK